ncbi:serine/threonine-protein kinase HAL4/sat4 [Mortierella polycephala]|uniref:Serine/threonine-protein kinase HAL4/sat4 n=1 Tax=Mortierella polycephala TaxID=41804 RepID=A0A9P6TVH8_9FUNG|nr:serine/threonine-protein kinase HAL4/sat4 [Mortierella polycephala]
MADTSDPQPQQSTRHAIQHSFDAPAIEQLQPLPPRPSNSPHIPGNYGPPASSSSSPMDNNGRSDIAVVQNIPQAHLQQPSPAPSTRMSKKEPVSVKPNYAHHLFSQIPSVNYLEGASNPSSRSRSTASSNASPFSEPTSGYSPVNESKYRFEQLPNGGHRHHLSAPRRHEFLANKIRRLRELLEGKGEKNGHDNAHQHGHGHEKHHNGLETLKHPLSLLNEKMQDFEFNHHALGDSKKNHTVKEEFVQKYGELQETVGKGAFGTVRLAVKKNPEDETESVFAVKEFRYHRHGESLQLYMRRLTSEFCIASSLRHINVIKTLDLLHLHGEYYSEVMEYCSGGDLHTLVVSANTMDETESNCFFAQLINGVAYLHSMGVAHRDLKPENLLLTADGCVKIADFGNSEVFRMPWETKIRSSASIRGSGPFIAPEEFTTAAFDARKVDMWSCGIIYMCMRLGRYNWAEASRGDPMWDSFLEKVKRSHKPQDNTEDLEGRSSVSKFINLRAIEDSTNVTFAWSNHISEVINKLLEPNSKHRWQAGQVLDSYWMQNVDNCHPAERSAELALDETDFDPQPSQRVGSKVLQHDSEMTGWHVVNEIKSRRNMSDSKVDNDLNANIDTAGATDTTGS